MGIFSGFFAVFILFALLIIGGIVALVLFLVKQGASPANKNEEVNERNEVIATAKAGVPELIPWGNKKATDLCTRAKFTYFKGFKGTLKGKLLDQNNEKIISFYRIQRGFNPHGLIAASSTDFDLFYIFDSSKVDMYYNKVKIATWEVDGKIYTSQSQLIGNAFRSQDFEVEIGSLFEYRSGDAAYSINLHGHVVAKIVKNRRLSDFGFSLLSNIPESSKVIHYIGTPKDDEEKILLLLTIFELTYYGFSFVDV